MIERAIQPPTTRWRNPDKIGPDGKGELIGSPDAAIATLQPVTHKFTYPKKEDEDRRDAALAAKHAPALSSPVESVAPVDVDGLDEMKATIRDLARAAKTGNAEAATALTRLRDMEYLRPNGGRTAIKRALASAGYGKP